jgi:hypothetical protein
MTPKSQEISILLALGDRIFLDTSRNKFLYLMCAKNPISLERRKTELQDFLCGELQRRGFDGGETGSTEVVKHWLHTEWVTISLIRWQINTKANTEFALAA